LFLATFLVALLFSVWEFIECRQQLHGFRHSIRIAVIRISSLPKHLKKNRKIKTEKGISNFTVSLRFSTTPAKRHTFFNENGKF